MILVFFSSIILIGWFRLFFVFVFMLMSIMEDISVKLLKETITGKGVYEYALGSISLLSGFLGSKTSYSSSTLKCVR